MGPVALVTGASSHIGEAITATLAQQGWTVYAAAPGERMESPRTGGGIVAIAMDPTDDASLVSGVRQVIREQGRVDALVNIAGHGCYGSVEHTPLDEARRQFEVDVFSMGRLVQLVIPHLRSRGSGRIVNISSIGDAVYEPLAAWHHASRSAVEGFSDSLRIELRPFGIDVVVVEPGSIRSERNRVARESLVERLRGTVYERRARAMARRFERADSPGIGSGPEVVAEQVLRALTTVNPAARYPAGRGARAVAVTRRLLPDRALDLLVRAVYRDEGPAR